MNTISSTLGLFALKSYVSVLPEMKKETALRITGGGLNINNPDDREQIDEIINDRCDYPFGDGPSIDNNLIVNEDGDIIDTQCGQGLGDSKDGDNIIGPNEWNAIKEQQDEKAKEENGKEEKCYE